MKRWILFGMLILSASIVAVLLLFSPANQDSQTSIGESPSLAMSEHDVSEERDSSLSPSKQDVETIEAATNQLAFDFQSIGLPDFSEMDLAPGVIERLAEWQEAGCVDFDSISVESLSMTSRRKIDRWLEEEGNFGGLDSEFLGMSVNMDFGDYSTYSDATLEQLADGANDAKAALALAQRQRQDEEQKLERLEQAIVLGYTWPLRRMAILRNNVRVEANTGPANDLERQRELYTDWLAYSFLLERRGGAAPNAPVIFIRSVEQNSVSSIQASLDSVRSSARERAERLYREYSAQRRELGLGPFDNSRPVIATQVDKQGELQWLSHFADLPDCDEFDS